MSKKHHPIIVAIVGPRASGGSTLNKFLARLLGPIYLALDSSKLCDEHIAKKTPFGIDLAKQRRTRDTGGLYDSGPVVGATIHEIHMATSLENSRIQIVGLAGGLRHPDQLALLQSRGFEEIYAIHITVTDLREVFCGVKLRMDMGDERRDSDPQAVVDSWINYNRHVVPTMEKIGVNCLPLAKTYTPLYKLEAALSLLPFHDKPQVVKNFLQPDHPARVDAIKLEQEIKRHDIQLTPDMEMAIQQYENTLRRQSPKPAHSARLDLPFHYDGAPIREWNPCQERIPDHVGWQTQAQVTGS